MTTFLEVEGKVIDDSGSKLAQKITYLIRGNKSMKGDNGDDVVKLVQFGHQLVISACTTSMNTAPLPPPSSVVYRKSEEQPT